MGNKVVVFGLKQFAQLAKFYIDNCSNDECIGFTVDDAYYNEDKDIKENNFVKPLSYYLDSKDEFLLFCPLSARKMNFIREDIYERLKKLDFNFYSFVHPSVQNYGTIGDNCFVLENNLIQPFSTVSDNVVIWSNNHIGHHSSIGANTTITSGVIVSGNTTVGKNCYFGVNSSVRDGLKVPDKTFLGMGCVLNKNLKEENLVISSPKMEISSVPSDRLKWI